jgi:hypothetical protein
VAPHPAGISPHPAGIFRATSSGPASGRDFRRIRPGFSGPLVVAPHPAGFPRAKRARARASATGCSPAAQARAPRPAIRPVARPAASGVGARSVVTGRVGASAGARLARVGTVKARSAPLAWQNTPALLKCTASPACGRTGRAQGRSGHLEPGDLLQEPPPLDWHEREAGQVAFLQESKVLRPRPRPK